MKTGQHVTRRQVMELLARLQEQTAVGDLRGHRFPRTRPDRQPGEARLAVDLCGNRVQTVTPSTRRAISTQPCTLKKFKSVWNPANTVPSRTSWAFLFRGGSSSA